MLQFMGLKESDTTERLAELNRIKILETCSCQKLDSCFLLNCVLFYLLHLDVLCFSTDSFSSKASFETDFLKLPHTLRCLGYSLENPTPGFTGLINPTL